MGVGFLATSMNCEPPDITIRKPINSTVRETNMKNSTIITTCLMNSKMCGSVQIGEEAVRRVFHDHFDEGLFEKWDITRSKSEAKAIIGAVGCASTINVASFISDLQPSGLLREP
jgi:hypothetical protein